MTRGNLIASALTSFGLVLGGGGAPAHAAVASCYADGTDGFVDHASASGIVVRENTIGVASRTLPLRDTVLMVKVDGRRPIRARVIDRGPYVDGRVLDVTGGTARALGFNDCAAWGVRSIRTWRAR